MWTAKVLYLFKSLVVNYIFDNFNKGYYEMDELHYIFNKFRKNFRKENTIMCAICLESITNKEINLHNHI